MAAKVSEKKLLFAVLSIACGLWLIITNRTDLRADIISEKELLFSVIGVCLLSLGVLFFTKAFKRINAR